MARIRTIKPEFFTSEDIVSLSPLARLLYIALWCEADREGRLSWKPKTFKMRYLPADRCDVEALCSELVTAGLVCLYGDGLAFIPAFSEHQNINPREAESKLPPPNDACRTRADASNLDLHDQRGKEGKGEEGRGETRDASVPLETVLEFYHSTLPACQRIASVTDGRRKALRKAEVNARRICRARGWVYGPDFWQDFFAECAKDPWYRGDVPNPKNSAWRQTLDVLLRDDHFAKIMDAALAGGAA